MQTKVLMIFSSFFMGLLGLILIFTPDEVMVFLDVTSNAELLIIIQITGALYFGFGILNWMARNVLIGGIFSKPLAIGNFSHFLIAGMALLKMSFNPNTSSILIYDLSAIYTLLALSFGLVLLTNPSKN